MAETFVFTRRARRPGAYALVGGAILILLALIFLLDAHPVVVVLVALLTAPAVWDILRDAEARLTLDDEVLSWHSGARAHDQPVSEIAEVVLRARLDFSQTATVRREDGTALRIPPECLPRGRALDAALEARGIPNRRSLFGG